MENEPTGDLETSVHLSALLRASAALNKSPEASRHWLPLGKAPACVAGVLRKGKKKKTGDCSRFLIGCDCQLIGNSAGEIKHAKRELLTAFLGE